MNSADDGIPDGDHGAGSVFSLATGIAAFSAAAHLVAFVFAAPLPLMTDGRILTLVSAALSAYAYSSRDLTRFHYAYALRTAVLFALACASGGQGTVVAGLVLYSYVLETSVYFHVRRSLALNAFATAAWCAGWAYFAPPEASAPTAAVLSAAVLLAAAAGGIGALSVHYRESIVRARRAIRNQDGAIAKLTEANRDFQLYANTVEDQSAENERNRITRELHDTTGYALTNLIMMMNAGKLLVRKNPDAARDLFEEGRLQADGALREIRQILYKIRELEDSRPKGMAAVARLCKVFQTVTGVEVEASYGNLPMSLGDAIDAAVYRLAQEGLTNAFKHGRAKRIRISLWKGEREIRIIVWDDGRGSDGAPEGIGLKGMKERFAALGGEVATRNVVDGFELCASIPLKTMEEADEEDTHSNR